MAAPEPTVTTIDLRTDVPAGWTLAGLSEPKFDGVNYYRVPQAERSTLTFTLDSAQFVELEYQLYSPSTDVTVSTRFDGRLISQQDFMAGRLESAGGGGGLLTAGRHTLELSYRCPSSCKNALSQYSTGVRFVDIGDRLNDHQNALKTSALSPDDPTPSLFISGTGPLMFDSKNLLRRVTGESMQLSWTSDRALNAHLRFYADSEFKVTASIGEKHVDTQKAGGSHGASLFISLVPYPDARSLTVNVECLGSTVTRGCAYVYFPQVTVDTTPPVTAPVLAGAVLAVVMGVTALWRLLAPVRA